MSYVSLKTPSIKSFEAEFYISKSNDAIESRHFPAHVHDNLEIYVLLEGDVSFVVENEVYRLSAGDAIVSRPNQVHNCILNSTSVHKHVCMWFNMGTEFIYSAFSSSRVNHVKPSEEDKKRLEKLYDKMEAYGEQGHEMGTYYTLLEVLDVIARNMGQADSENKEMPDILRQIMCELNDNFSHITSLDYLTDKFFISYSTLYRLFKTYLNVSPKEYLEVKKLAYSRVLLKQGYSVKEACAKAGFTDCSNYIRLFRSRFGITPKQYQS